MIAAAEWVIKCCRGEKKNLFHTGEAAEELHLSDQLRPCVDKRPSIGPVDRERNRTGRKVENDRNKDSRTEPGSGTVRSDSAEHGHRALQL